MFKPRSTAFWKILSREDWDFKLYRIQADQHRAPLYSETYEREIERLIPEALDRNTLKEPDCPKVGFIICHEGLSMSYLVLCAWGNDNELFTEVRTCKDGVWSNSREYSFCLYDMEVMWFERNAFVETMYSGVADRKGYLERHLVSEIS